MTDRITYITSQFAPISLADINARASLQVRADNKYFVPWQAFVDFTATLSKSYAVMEIGGKRAFAYDTQYFDTPDLASYWGHMQGRRKRFKCRSRVYVDSDLCVFELKLKGGRGETVKHKINYSEASRKEVNAAAMAFLRDRLGAAYGMELTKELVPTLHNNYQRVTLASLDSPERVTCDFNLAFGDGERWLGHMTDDYVLVEIKSARGRGPADQLLWKLGVRPGGGSKYCVGLSLVRPELRSNPFMHARKQYFSPAGVPQAERAPSGRLTAMPAPTVASPLTALPSATAAMLE